MSRKSSQIVTLKAQGKGCSSSHNLPKELIFVTERIEKLSFVTEHLGKLRWKPKTTKSGKRINIKGFDYNRKSFCADISGKAYQQKFFIKVDIPKDENLLESKCLEMGIDVKERQENCYYYNQLKDFYEKEIVKVVEDFYNN
jgi:hypothetical protein